MSTHMLRQGHDLRRERKNFKDMNDKLFKFWDDHSTYKVTTEQLLEKVTVMYTSFNAVRYGKNVNDGRAFENETE